MSTPSTTATAALLDQVSALPLDSWIAVGRAALGRHSSAGAEACAAIERAIAEQQLGLAAWRLRDDVAAIAYVARRSSASLSRADRRAIAAARDAVEAAALALLVREHVSPNDIALLCAPFAAQAWLDKGFGTSPASSDGGSLSGDSTDSPGTRILNTLPPASRSA